MNKNKAKKEYVCGFLDGRARFLFYNNKSGGKEVKIPTFLVSSEDRSMVILTKNLLFIRNRVYEHPSKIGRDGYLRRYLAEIIIRDVGQLKNKVVPFFYGTQSKIKRSELHDWIQKIGSDPMVPERYKIISKLYSRGFYNKK